MSGRAPSTELPLFRVKLNLRLSNSVTTHPSTRSQQIAGSWMRHQSEPKRQSKPQAEEVRDACH